MFYSKIKPTRGGIRKGAARYALNLMLGCVLVFGEIGALPALVYAQKPGGDISQEKKKDPPGPPVVRDAAPQKGKPSNELKLGVKLERQFRAEEIHAYSIQLTLGDYLKVMVVRGRVRVRLTLTGPNNKSAASTINTFGLEGLEILSAVAEVTGRHVLTIESLTGKEGGDYSISIQELRAATDKDRALVRAEIVMFEANRLALRSSTDSLKSAIDKYNEALPLWRELGNRRQEAFTLIKLGDAYRTLGISDKALTSYQQALPISEDLGDKDSHFLILVYVAGIYNDDSNYQEAIKYLEKALNVSAKLDESAGKQALILNNLGMNYSELGSRSRALEYFNQALEVVEESRDLFLRAVTLTNIGMSYHELNDPLKALDFLQQSLKLFRSISDRSEEGAVLEVIGGIYNDLGDNEKAIEYYLQSIAVLKTAGTTSGLLSVYTNIGAAYQGMGESEKALVYYSEALALAEEFQDQQWQRRILNSIASMYVSKGDLAKGLEFYNQALKVTSSEKDPQQEAKSLAGLGLVYLRMGDNEKARINYSQALLVSREADSKEIEADILVNLARIERSRGKLPDALSLSETAITLLESLYSDSRAKANLDTYTATAQDAYRVQIDVLMRLHKIEPQNRYDVRAFEVNERSRVQAIAHVLTSVRGEEREDVPKALTNRQSALRREINTKVQYQQRLLNGPASAQEVESTARAINNLLPELAAVEAQIKLKSKRYAELAQIEPPRLTQIREMLDKDTLLLEYSLGEERSYLWAVTSRMVTSYELAPRADIEKAALRVYQMLSSRGKELSPAVYWPAASSLSQMVLGPMASHPPASRLLIVADGALQYVPFAALPFPAPRDGKTSEGRNDGIPIILTHEIVNLPSAGIYMSLRRDFKKRPTGNKVLAVFADPVLEPDDPRVNKPGNSAVKTSGVGFMPALQQPRRATPPDQGPNGVESRARFQRLPFAKQEATQILSFVAPAQRKQAFGFDASRKTATSSEMSQYRIIHFATQAFINADHPGLSGVILSLVDKQGSPQDGILFAQDIYNLNLRAELVVLSGCRTVLEKENKGSGLFGITRSFLYAGAARVVGSMWDVDDEATAQLMKSFYRGMLKENLRPAAALRLAQLEMLKSPRWSAPNYWSAFLLQGEWQ